MKKSAEKEKTKVTGSKTKIACITYSDLPTWSLGIDCYLDKILYKHKTPLFFP